MKASLTFDLDQPDDRMAHMRCVKATDMAITLWEIRVILRSMEKDDAVTQEEYLGALEMHDRITAIMDDNGINLDELTQ